MTLPPRLLKIVFSSRSLSVVYLLPIPLSVWSIVLVIRLQGVGRTTQLKLFSCSVLRVHPNLVRVARKT